MALLEVGWLKGGVGCCQDASWFKAPHMGKLRSRKIRLSAAKDTWTVMSILKTRAILWGKVYIQRQIQNFCLGGA